jgi:pimeloyl-ACP methyl ester carboxylesterase
MKRRTRSLAITVGALVAVVACAVWYARRPSKGHPSALVPADTSLRRDWLYFYPQHTTAAARGIVILFGNDVAFWEPHQDLAWRLADDGYAVAGINLRRFLNTLPPEEPQRDSAFGAAMPVLIAKVRHVLGADSLPLVVGGHSFGAEVAFWLAARRPPEHLVGVLALNTRASGHLYITPRDWLNEEASGAWSFSVADMMRHTDPQVRIALVRGEKDLFRKHDPELVAAGGARLRRFVIPFATHSLTTMLVAAPIVSRAVRFLTDTTAGAGR